MDLQDIWDNEKRDKLRKRGWVMTPVPGGNVWREPGGTVLVSEEEAFLRLERQQEWEEDSR